MRHIARIYNAIRRIIKNLLFSYTKDWKNKKTDCEKAKLKNKMKSTKQKLSPVCHRFILPNRVPLCICAYLYILPNDTEMKNLLCVKSIFLSFLNRGSSKIIIKSRLT